MIFIIGGNGFIGSAIVRECLRQNEEYIVITRENYSQYIGKKCNILINANGNSKKYISKSDPIWDFDASVKSVRSALIDFSYDMYVQISSCDVYPDCSAPVLTSENCIPDISKQSLYGFHKYIAEQCVQHVAGKWLVFRMGGMVGLGMKKNPVYDILNGGPLWLNPLSALQFINTDTAAKIIITIIKHGIFNEVFNLCGDRVIVLEEIIDTIKRKIQVQPGSPIVRYEVNIEKIKSFITIPDTKSTVLNFVKSYKGDSENAG